MAGYDACSVSRTFLQPILRVKSPTNRKLTTLSKYLSRHSTRLWINSSVANSFWKKIKADQCLRAIEKFIDMQELTHASNARVTSQQARVKAIICESPWMTTEWLDLALLRNTIVSLFFHYPTLTYMPVNMAALCCTCNHTSSSSTPIMKNSEAYLR